MNLTNQFINYDIEAKEVKQAKTAEERGRVIAHIHHELLTKMHPFQYKQVVTQKDYIIDKYIHKGYRAVYDVTQNRYYMVSDNTNQREEISYHGYQLFLYMQNLKITPDYIKEVIRINKRKQELDDYARENQRKDAEAQSPTHTTTKELKHLMQLVKKEQEISTSDMMNINIQYMTGYEVVQAKAFPIYNYYVYLYDTGEYNVERYCVIDPITGTAIAQIPTPTQEAVHQAFGISRTTMTNRKTIYYDNLTKHIQKHGITPYMHYLLKKFK